MTSLAVYPTSSLPLSAAAQAGRSASLLEIHQKALSNTTAMYHSSFSMVPCSYHTVMLTSFSCAVRTYGCPDSSWQFTVADFARMVEAGIWQKMTVLN